MLRRSSPLPTRRVTALRNRAFATAPRAARPLLGRYNKTPMVLYRVQNGEKVILREHSEQMKLKRTSFDLKLGADGLVHPATGPNFIGPNGASLRPAGFVFGEIVANFRGPRMCIIEIPSGIVLPKELVLLHEHSDHYSLQTSEKRTLKGMCLNLVWLCHPLHARRTQCDSHSLHQALPCADKGSVLQKTPHGCDVAIKASTADSSEWTSGSSRHLDHITHTECGGSEALYCRALIALNIKE